MNRYLIIEKGIVVNIVIGEVDGGVKASGGLEFASIGDVVKNKKIIPVTQTADEIYEDKKRQNDSNWEQHDNLFTQWQKAEALGWVSAIARKKKFDAKTIEVDKEYRELKKLEQAMADDK